MKKTGIICMLMGAMSLSGIAQEHLVSLDGKGLNPT